MSIKRLDWRPCRTSEQGRRVWMRPKGDPDYWDWQWWTMPVRKNRFANPVRPSQSWTVSATLTAVFEKLEDCRKARNWWFCWSKNHWSSTFRRNEKGAKGSDIFCGKIIMKERGEVSGWRIGVWEGEELRGLDLGRRSTEAKWKNEDCV